MYHNDLCVTIKRYEVIHCVAKDNNGDQFADNIQLLFLFQNYKMPKFTLNLLTITKKSYQGIAYINLFQKKIKRNIERFRFGITKRTLL